MLGEYIMCGGIQLGNCKRISFMENINTFLSVTHNKDVSIGIDPTKNVDHSHV